MSLEDRVIEGRYRVDRRLSTGGMGTVWLGKDLRLHRAVVIKVPKPELLADPRFVTRFRREAEALQRIEHPHVIPILDTGSVDEVPFVVMPYLAGGSLAERLASRPGHRASLPEVLAWLRPIADALDYLHERELVHRDVKPANVLFDAHGHPYLTDFGIALAHEAGDQRLTQTSALMPGTPAYMAPEQALKGAVNGAADQYALAVTTYEALTGTLPFRGSTAIEILVQKRTGRWVAGTDTPIASPALQVLRRAIAAEPSKRFSSCKRFLDELAAAQESPASPPAARHGRRSPRVPPAWRHMIPAGVIAILAIVAIMFVDAQEESSARRQEVAVPPLTDALPAAASGRPPSSVPPKAVGVGEQPPPSPTATAATPAAKPAGSPAAPAPSPFGARRRAEREDVPRLAPLPPGVTLEVTSPTEGEVVNDDVVTVTGRVDAQRGTSHVYVGSLAVPVKEGRFSIDIPLGADDDGEQAIEVGLEPSRPITVRNVVVDRQDPRIDVSVAPEPPPGAGPEFPAVLKEDVVLLPEAVAFRVRIRALDASLAAVHITWTTPAAERNPLQLPEGQYESVPVDAQGNAELLLPRGLLRSRMLVVRAKDRVGHTARLVRTLLVVPRIGLAFDAERTTRPTDLVWRAFARVHPAVGDTPLALRLGSPKDAHPLPAGWLLELPSQDRSLAVGLTAQIHARRDTFLEPQPLGPSVMLLQRPAAAAEPSLPLPAAARTPRAERLLCPVGGGASLPVEVLPPFTIEAWVRCLDPLEPACTLFAGVGPERLHCDIHVLKDGTPKISLTRGPATPTETGEVDTGGIWSLPTLSRDAPLHAALVMERERTTLFLDGKRIGVLPRQRAGSAGDRASLVVVVRPQLSRVPNSALMQDPGRWRYELLEVRLTPSARYLDEFRPIYPLTQDDPAALVYRPARLEDRAFWPDGGRGTPMIPAGYGRLTTDPIKPTAGPEPTAAQPSAVYLSGSGWAFWSLTGPMPEALTLEARVRRWLPWGQHVLLSAPGLELALEDGVPVVYARVRDRSVLSAHELRLAASTALEAPEGWRHLVLDRVGQDVRLLVDGVVVGAGRLAEAPQHAGPTWSVGIGGVADGPAMCVAELDDVRVSSGRRYEGGAGVPGRYGVDAQTLHYVGFDDSVQPLKYSAAGSVPNALPSRGGVLLIVPESEPVHAASPPVQTPPKVKPKSSPSPRTKPGGK